MRTRWDSLRDNESFCSVAELVDLLRLRGLIIRDDQRVKHALRVVGYHRLRDYFSPFYIDATVVGDQLRFRPGSSFNSVLNLYYLDRELRFFLLGPLEKLEVSLRGNIIDALGQYYRSLNPTGSISFDLLNAEHFNLSSEANQKSYGYIKHEVFSAASRIADRDQKQKIEAARKSNGSNKLMADFAPWPVVHKLSFGPLAMIFNVLKPDIARNIASEYDVTVGVLRSCLGVLRVTRNSCAHHEPFWFRSVPKFDIPEKIQPQIWALDAKLSERKTHGSEYRIYELCAIIHFLLSKVSENTTWYKRLRTIIERFDKGAQEFMGFPADWTDLSFWRSPTP